VPSACNPLISDAAYKRELEIVSNEVFEATYIYHVMEEINELLLNDRTLFTALNKQPLFWQAHRTASQAALFMCLGRIFDTNENAKSIHRLVRITRVNFQVFSKAALGRRKMEAGPKPPWFDDYMQGTWEPASADDLKPLKEALKPHRKLFEAVYRPIRHAVYGHRFMGDDEAGRELFPHTNREAIGKILDFLHDLTGSLLELYLNGVRPELGSRDFTEYNQRIRDDARSVMRSLSARADS